MSKDWSVRFEQREQEARAISFALRVQLAAMRGEVEFEKIDQRLAGRRLSELPLSEQRRLVRDALLEQQVEEWATSKEAEKVLEELASS